MLCLNDKNEIKTKEEEVKTNPTPVPEPATKPESLLKQEVSNIKTEEDTEEEEVEKAETKSVRVYSRNDTSKVVYLKRIQTLAEVKRPSRIVKYPLASTFTSKVRECVCVCLLFMCYCQ